jgi:hypothetical protein
MALNGFSGVVAFGALPVDVVSGHNQGQADFMRIMTTGAARF